MIRFEFEPKSFPVIKFRIENTGVHVRRFTVSAHLRKGKDRYEFDDKAYDGTSVWKFGSHQGMDLSKDLRKVMGLGSDAPVPEFDGLRFNIEIRDGAVLHKIYSFVFVSSGRFWYYDPISRKGDESVVDEEKKKDVS